MTELIAISEAANWPWGPACRSYNENGRPIPTTKIRIFSDAQSALQSIGSWRASACQAVVAEIIKKLRTNNVTLYWVPGHAGIKENEEANKLAKAATRKESPEAPQRSGRPWYLVTQELKKAGVTAVTAPLRTSPTGRFTRKIDGALHLGKAAELYRQLSSSEAAILAQLRTGKSFLNEYLYKINAVDTASCACGHIESIAHFLFSCRRWTQQRAELRRQHGDRFRDLSYALGGYSSRQEGGSCVDGPLKDWKPDIKVVKATIQYAKDTGRLNPSEQDSASVDDNPNDRLLITIPTPTHSP
jgi:hypothetical protein